MQGASIRANVLITVAILFLVLPLVASAEITRDGDLKVRILYDNSGSMWPGFSLTSGRKPAGRSFYHEYPQFRQWVEDFAKRQSILNGAEVELWSFTSGPGPTARKILRRAVAPGDFVFPSATSFPAAGRTTYLKESLEQFTRGFEGIVWLISDNIVQKPGGSPLNDVRQFFAAMRSGKRFRSVHLYKLPFAQLGGPAGTLAVYGFLVSDSMDSGSEAGKTLLAHYDGKFRQELLNAVRESGGPLFPGQGYWKLKEVEVGPVAFEPGPVRVEILDPGNGPTFRASKKISLIVSGLIRSQLTQEVITGGPYRLRIVTSALPQEPTYGIAPIPATQFTAAEGLISPGSPIPPGEVQEVAVRLDSKEPISLKPRGVVNWVKSALGIRVHYQAHVVAEFAYFDARFDRGRMAEIFGAELAPEVFGISEENRYPGDITEKKPIDFFVESSYGRMFVGFLLLLLLLLLIAGIFFLFAGKRQFRVRLGESENIFGLRRTRSRDLFHDAYRVGRLKRQLAGDGLFAPEEANAAVKVSEAPGGGWEVKVRDHASVHLSIEPVDGGKVTTAKRRRGRQDRTVRPTRTLVRGTGGPASMPAAPVTPPLSGEPREPAAAGPASPPPSSGEDGPSAGAPASRAPEIRAPGADRKRPKIRVPRNR